jgi:hypothetical protein
MDTAHSTSWQVTKRCDLGLVQIAMWLYGRSQVGIWLLAWPSEVPGKPSAAPD